MMSRQQVMSDWRPISTAPERMIVETKIDDGGGERNVAELYRDGPLWYFPGSAVHVFYDPTHWRPVESSRV